ncbi:hypothetical protein V9K67_26165 [Paraflavisolibacter sp. H34]|uniref:hypothetical protein n=1 Tax=Huijunlia imazamoxiresistens TaxID=3127457 RepID=UPI00301A3346
MALDIAALKNELHRLVDQTDDVELLVELYGKLSAGGVTGVNWWDELEVDAQPPAPPENQFQLKAAAPAAPSASAEWWEELDAGLQVPPAGAGVSAEPKDASDQPACPEPSEGFHFDIETGEWKW